MLYKACKTTVRLEGRSLALEAVLLEVIVYAATGQLGAIENATAPRSRRMASDPKR